MILMIAKAMKRAGRDKRGFTLVELMAVMAVLAIIAAIAVPRFTGTINQAKINADKSSALIVARAAEQKWIDDGEDSAEDYLASELATANYLREKPKVQANSTYTNYKAEVNSSGKCTGVYYSNDNGTSTSSSNLLE
ncbi:MAG: type II secretion system protein [Bacillota bacterium]|nr:type II secretion system protein [Bacillota bacterium]